MTQAFATFEARPSAVARARRFIAHTLRSWGVGDVGAPMVVVSELAANAVLHAGPGPFAITVDVEPPTVRIEVRDGVDRFPRVRQVDEDTTSGRGMQIVDRLSRSWGARPEATGKVVWVEIEVDR